MKPTTKYVIATACAIVIAAAAGCGYAFRSNPQKFAALYVEYVAKELELNETQTAKLSVLKDAVLKARDATRIGREEKTKAALALLDKPTIDRPRALGLWQQAMHDLGDQGPGIIITFGDFYDSLTPAQQKKVRETIKQRAERFNR